MVRKLLDQSEENAGRQLYLVVGRLLDVAHGRESLQWLSWDMTSRMIECQRMYEQVN